MHKPRYFYRSARTGELMELFMVSAASSLLITRFLLHLAHYPTLGGHSLHIAHMLWGGVLMTIGVILLLAFIGIRLQRRASVIAGLGFGLFIDELGKFITQDNNYFFRPTIGLIYLVFVLLFIASRSLSQTRHLSKHEYLLNALAMTEEVVIDDLDEVERKQVLAYLKQADQDHPLVPALTRILQHIKPIPPTRSWWHRWTRGTQQAYERIIAHPKGNILFNGLFLLSSAVFLFVVLTVFHPSADGNLHFSAGEIAEIISAFVPPFLVFVGVVGYRRHRLQRYQLFSIALLWNIFVTQFFSFYHDQFSALPGFIINIAFYIGIRSLIKHEQRLQLADNPA